MMTTKRTALRKSVSYYTTYPFCVNDISYVFIGDRLSLVTVVKQEDMIRRVREQ